jgi:hypothetical protein
VIILLERNISGNHNVSSQKTIEIDVLIEQCKEKILLG